MSLPGKGPPVLRADLNCSERGSRFGGAAGRYAEIASAAPHAQHILSHIFTRVGYWEDAVVSNLAAVGSA
jgi:hypothetical protein